MVSGPPPSFCRLSPPDLEERIGAWRALSPLVVERRPTDDGLSITFAPEAADRVTELVRAERSCCDWATWTVETEDRGVVVHVHGPREPMAALAGALGV